MTWKTGGRCATCGHSPIRARARIAHLEDELEAERLRVSRLRGEVAWYEAALETLRESRAKAMELLMEAMSEGWTALGDKITKMAAAIDAEKKE